MAEPRDDRTPTCPFCGSARHDSEWLHDGNVMTTAELVDAMLMLFLRNPDEVRPAGIWPDPFPDAYEPVAVQRFRAKMGAALGTAIRNMPYLAALRSPGLDRDGERMRERCARACDARALGCKTAAQEWAEGSVNFPPQPEIAHAFMTAADQCRQLAEIVRALPLAHEEKAGC